MTKNEARELMAALAARTAPADEYEALAATLDLPVAKVRSEHERLRRARAALADTQLRNDVRDCIAVGAAALPVERFLGEGKAPLLAALTALAGRGLLDPPAVLEERFIRLMEPPLLAHRLEYPLPREPYWPVGAPIQRRKRRP
jgi:hypothetical protein